jgi:hypothetical protein
MKVPILGLVQVIVLFCVFGDAKEKSRTKPGFPLVLEANKIYHGVFAGNEDRPELFNAAYLKNYTDAVQPGRKLAWVYFSNEWDVDPTFPKAACSAIHSQGATPFIRLMLRKDPYANPTNPGKIVRGRPGREEECGCEQGTPHPSFSFTKILDGCFDGPLQEWGRQAAMWGHPLIVEWGTECNGCWFWWNGKHNGDAAGPPRFIAAYRHIVDQIRKGAIDAKGPNGANAIQWAFHLNYDSCPKKNAAWNQPGNYFPARPPNGKYVDWIAVSIYGNQDPFGKPAPFAAQFEPCYHDILRYAPKLPIIIAEMATTKTRDGADAEWTKAALDWLKSGRWKNVRGFAWWNDAFQAKENKGLVCFRVECNDRVAAVLRSFLKDTVVGEANPLVEK